MRYAMIFLALCGMAFGILMESGTTTPSIKVVMRSSAGAAVTGLTCTAFNVFVSESLAAQVEFDDDEGTNDVVDLTTVNEAYTADRTTIGVKEIGNGVYRMDLPKTLVDGGAGKFVSLAIVDNTAAALNTYVLIELTPSVNAVLVNGNTPFNSGSDTVIVGSMSTGAITADAIAADAIGASELKADAAAEIADAVWDEARGDHISSGSFGEIFLYESWYSVTDSYAVESSGSTRTTVKFGENAFPIDDPVGRIVLISDATGPIIATRIVTGYNASTYTLSVFPSLSFIPTTGDSVLIKRMTFSLLPTDIARFSSRN